jgi:hypothetical protein
VKKINREGATLAPAAHLHLRQVQVSAGENTKVKKINREGATLAPAAHLHLRQVQVSAGENTKKRD